jgi:DNA-binding PadR family transcriptional regulator
MTTEKCPKLSELEGVSLGIVYKQRSCTAYQVRSELKKAPSSHWRASAGSLYPLLARLEAEGLLNSANDENDGRGRKLVSVTAMGRKALREWVVAGVDIDLISSVTDPVRSRTFFLEVLSNRKQLNLVDKLIAQMENYLSETESHLKSESEKQSLYDYLGGLGAVKITAARLDWLRVVRTHLREK